MVELAKPGQRNPTEAAQVAVYLTQTPTTLEAPDWQQPGLQVSGNTTLLVLPGIARYLIKDGHQIDVTPANDSVAADVRLFLLGTAFGILCHQRGSFPLHASAVTVNQHAVAFIGPSGAGKSTLGAWLSRSGYPLLSDDVCILSPGDYSEHVWTGSGPPLLHPGSPRIKLWSDTLAELGIERQGLQRDMSRTDKFHLTLPSIATERPRPLQAIYLIGNQDADQASIQGPLQPLAAIAAIADNTYRHELIATLKRSENHFRICAHIAQEVPVFQLHRPRSLAALDSVVTCLQQHWEQQPIQQQFISNTATPPCQQT